MHVGELPRILKRQAALEQIVAEVGPVDATRPLHLRIELRVWHRVKKRVVQLPGAFIAIRVPSIADAQKVSEVLEGIFQRVDLEDLTTVWARLRGAEEAIEEARRGKERAAVDAVMAN